MDSSLATGNQLKTMRWGFIFFIYIQRTFWKINNTSKLFLFYNSI
ncbi:hypothetical protein FORC087_563 (plasmid) [Bacillus cereus]|nr:hypothetical protein FORC087_563 [Bacillus cereus]